MVHVVHIMRLVCMVHVLCVMRLVPMIYVFRLSRINFTCGSYCTWDLCCLCGSKWFILFAKVYMSHMVNLGHIVHVVHNRPECQKYQLFYAKLCVIYTRVCYEKLPLIALASHSNLKRKKTHFLQTICSLEFAKATYGYIILD